MTPRIGVASVKQETNTFSVLPCDWEAFAVHGVLEGAELFERYAQTNTEVGGAVNEIARRGAIPVPLFRAWAMACGRLTAEAFDQVAELLERSLRSCGSLDGLVLSLHGAMAADQYDAADAELVRRTRQSVGPHTVIGVCLDLHANVTAELLDAADLVVGYHTYPHVDQASTGARAAGFVLDALQGTRPSSVLAKRRLLLPAETSQTTTGPMAELRRSADDSTDWPVLDVSIFPVQPWLDVHDQGTAVVVTTDGRPDVGARLAEELAEQLWNRRRDFEPTVTPLPEALRELTPGQGRPVVLSESADAPTGGAAGDSPATIHALLAADRGLHALTTVVDPPAVEHAFALGAGSSITTELGCHHDPRFHQPASVSGRIERLGDDDVVLTGPTETGLSVSMGRWAVIRSENLRILCTERPAPSFDPASYRTAGLEPARADVVVTRSANLFRAAYAEIADDFVLLDLPGATTSKLRSLSYTRAPRPMFPLDPETCHDAA